MTELEIKNYTKIVKGIAKQFGKNCEVVLHDYAQPYENTIIYIANGHITGRTIGDCGTNLGLEILRGVTENEDQYNYITQIRNGRIVRSTSIYLKGENDEPIGSICINLDITDMLAIKNMMEDLTFNNNDLHNGSGNGTIQQPPQEIFPSNINGLLDSLIERAIAEIGVPVCNMTREQKISVLSYLDHHGAFLIKKAGEQIASSLDISKFSLYNYLEEIRAENGV